jgi:hypothetical protein
MQLTQTPTEAPLVQMEKSMPETFRKSSSLELQGELVVSFQKPYRFVNNKASSNHHHLLEVESFPKKMKYSFLKGVGGIVELAPGYLPAAYDVVRKAGGLCIADEVQAGVARIGSHFWGFEAHGVIPDIVTMAKVQFEIRPRYLNSILFMVADRPIKLPMAHQANTHMLLFLIFVQGIGNGIPIGAVVTTPEIAQVLTRRSYFNTFGGNPVSTAGGHAVLKVLEKEKLQENAFVVGSYLKERLNMLKETHGSKLLNENCRHLNHFTTHYLVITFCRSV